MRLEKKLFSLRHILCSLLSMIIILVNPAGSQERFRRSPPYPEPFPELSLPTIQTHSLTNGLDLVVVRRQAHPIISMRLIILTGESSSPNDLPGLATLTARMLPKGTINLSASDIEETIEAIGGSLSVETFPDYSVFTFSFLEEYFDEALQVLGEMVLRPTFPRIELGNVQRTMFYELASQSTDPEFLARRLLLKILFENHPYKKIVFNQGVIKNLTRGHVLSFFTTYYRPNNAKLVLIGNLNLETASRKVSRYLSPWAKREWEHTFVTSLKPQEKLKICFVNLPQAKNATIYIGNIIFPITSPDYFPFIVLNQIVGGTSNSRLFMHLRESKGYAYYAFSEMQFFKTCGVFLIKTIVRSEVIDKALREILKEIDTISNARIPGPEIEQAKSYLIGNFPLNIETFENLSLKVSEIQVFDLGIEHWEDYHRNIMRITPEMVSHMGQRYNLHTPVIVIAAKNEVLDYLSEFEQVSVYSPDGTLQYLITKGDDE